MNDERELILQVVDEPIIRRDELASLLFRQGDIQAAIHAYPHLQRNLYGSSQKRLIQMKLRRRRQDVAKASAYQTLFSVRTSVRKSVL